MLNIYFYFFMYFINVILKLFRCLNEQKMSLIMGNHIPVKYTSVKTEHKYEIDQITLFLNSASLNNVIAQFCEQFNIKLVKNIL